MRIAAPCLPSTAAADKSAFAEPFVDRTFEFEQLKEAIKYMERQKVNAASLVLNGELTQVLDLQHVGKVVVRIAQ